MTENRAPGGPNHIAFEAFGVRVLVSVDDPEVLKRVQPLLPPGWQPCSISAVEKRLALVADEHGEYQLLRDGKTYSNRLDLDFALALLEGQLREYVALHAPDWIFVHAGAVAHRGKAIIIPGLSFAGKTTLVAGLVRSGAIYYSDEYALLDEQGLMHPYPKPLSIRNQQRVQVDHDVHTLGGTAGEEPVPVGAIVTTTYRAGAAWQPRKGSSGEGVLALLAHTVAAQERPSQVMRVLTRAAEDAVVIESNRGEADELAPKLLAEFESWLSPGV